MRKGITIYDAAYVALAQLLGTVLYITDEKLIRKMRNPRLIKHIRDFTV